MIRLPAPLLLLACAAQGCIIYEEHYVEPCDPDGDDCSTTWTWTSTTETTDPTTGTTTTDPGPTVTSDLELTVTSGHPGESLLSSLVAVGAFDLGTVDRVVFERDVEVLDTLSRDDELVLLLSVAADAEPGPVDVFVETRAGDGYVLEQPFEIVDDGTTGTSGDTGVPHDTGCP